MFFGVREGSAACRVRPLLSPSARAQTIRFKSELVRNITIKLGYANAKIYCSDVGAGAGAAAERVYESKGSSHPDTYTLEDGSGRVMRLVRHVSFVGACAGRASASRCRARPAAARAGHPRAAPPSARASLAQTAPGTTFSWRRCSTARRSWTPRCC
jgi:hypothetical protein